MRKAGLLDRKPPAATNGMLSAAKRDTGTEKSAEYTFRPSRSYTEYETRYYFRAAPSAADGILEVCLFTRKDLAEGKREPRFRIFLDYEKGDFESWDTAGKKWSRAKIDMLDTGDPRERYSCRGRNHAPERTLKLVNRRLGTGNAQDVETAVLDFQLRVRGNRLVNRHRLVTDMIDAQMGTVPGRLPADWMRFINRRVLEPGHCIFYSRGDGTGYCTCCRLRVRVPDTARHNMPGKCTCGCRVTYKSWKKQKYTLYRTRASLVQKLTDGQGLVYRQFSVRMDADRAGEYVPEITVHENYRVIFGTADGRGTLRERGAYEWGEFKHTGISRWCRDGMVNHGGYCYYGSSFGYARSVPYTQNLKRVLRGTNLQYVPAAEILKGTEGTVNVTAVLGDMAAGFPYEAFWKMGLKNFVRERAGRDGTEGLTRSDPCAKKPWQYLKVSREDLAQAAGIDATDQQMRIIQRAAEEGVRLTDGQVLWLDANVGVSVLMKYFALHTPHRVIRYIRERAGVPEDGAEGRERLHLWTDYLDTAEQLQWDLNDRAVFFPQDIRRAHDEAVTVFTIRKDREDAEKMRQKDLAMHGYARKVKRMFCYRDGKYSIKVPGRYLDFKHEGQGQHNCVATYYEKVLNGECIILFIRRRGEPDRPFCTVEIRHDAGKFRIIQNRTGYNRPAPPEAREFMKAAARAAQKIAEKAAREGTHGTDGI